MRIYTVEECSRMSDYYYRLWKRTTSQKLAKFYESLWAMWDQRAINGGYYG